MIAIIAVAIGIMLSGLLTADRTEAGASASAPSRYSQASSAGYQTWTRWLRGHRGGTSEYSSSNRSRR